MPPSGPSATLPDGVSPPKLPLLSVNDTLGVRRRRHYQRSFRAELLQFGGAPANPPVEEQRGRIVRRPRNRR